MSADRDFTSILQTKAAHGNISHWRTQSKAEAVSFIMDCLDPVRTFSAEKEQGVAVRVKLKAVLDDIHQAVQLFSHIGVPGAQIDLFYPGEVA